MSNRDSAKSGIAQYVELFTEMHHEIHIAIMMQESGHCYPVSAARFISPNSSCEIARIFVCNCMYISMSYHCSEYEFLGPESALERYSFRSASSSSLYWYVSTEFSVGACSDFRRNIPIGPNSRYQTRYAQVGCSARARARSRAGVQACEGCEDKLDRL